MVAPARIDMRTPNQRPPLVVDPYERDKERFQNYTVAKEFIERRQWQGRPRPGEYRPVFNYALGLCRKAISYVFPGPVTFTVPTPADRPELGEEQTAAVERLLADTLRELGAARLDFGLALDAAIYGDGASKITWDPVAAAPRLTAVDPGTLAVDWEPDDPTRAWRVHQRYALSGATIIERKLADASSELNPEAPYPVVERWTADRWRVSVAGQESVSRTNPYGWIPYLVLPNNARATAFWGESDLADLYDTFRAVNERIAVLGAILDLSGAPIAVLENVDGSDGVRVLPGAKWELPEGSKAYLLDLLAGQGVQLHVQAVDLLYRVMHDLSESPRSAFGDSGRDLSGAALEVEIQPLVQKVRRKRMGLDDYYRRRNGMLLDLLARFGGAETFGLRRTETVWPAILPSDEETRVSLVAQKVGSQLLSRRTGMAELGSTDPERELELIVDEARALQGSEEEGDQGRQGDDGEAGEGQEAKAKPESKRPNGGRREDGDDE